MDNLGSILSSVMSDEALMSKIKETVKKQNGDSQSSLDDIISLIAPKINSSNGADVLNTSKSTESNNMEELKNADKKNDSLSFINSISRSVTKNSGLLIALKPYLSKERRQVIESVIKLSQITDALNLL